MAGAADFEEAELFSGMMFGDCSAEPGFGGGPISASDKASGDIESALELSAVWKGPCDNLPVLGCDRGAW